jgi:hypothetical protein
MFASKKNRLLKKYASAIPTKDPDKYRECTKNRLKKVCIPHIITSPDSSDSENYTEICQQTILIVPKWKGQVWSILVEEFTMSRITLGDAETNNIGGPIQVFIGGKPVKNSLFLGLKTLKDLKDIPQK